MDRESKKAWLIIQPVDGLRRCNGSYIDGIPGAICMKTGNSDILFLELRIIADCGLVKTPLPITSLNILHRSMSELK